MQWLIDLLLESMKGVIVMWHGLITDIPDGWALCDGTQGTPDLAGNFIRGAVTEGDMHSIGGTLGHTHGFTSDHHVHDMKDGNDIDYGEFYEEVTDSEVVTGTTDIGANVPPFYRLAFIMKL